MSGAPQSPISKAKKWGKLKDPTKTPPTKVPADFEATFVKLENTWDPGKKEYSANLRLCVRMKAERVQLSLAATMRRKASTRSKFGVPNKLPSYSKSSAKSPRKTANVASPSSSHSTTTTK